MWQTLLSWLISKEALIYIAGVISSAIPWAISQYRAHGLACETTHEDALTVTRSSISKMRGLVRTFQEAIDKLARSTAPTAEDIEQLNHLQQVRDNLITPQMTNVDNFYQELLQYDKKNLKQLKRSLRAAKDIEFRTDEVRKTWIDIFLKRDVRPLAEPRI